MVTGRHGLTVRDGLTGPAGPCGKDCMYQLPSFLILLVDFLQLILSYPAEAHAKLSELRVMDPTICS